MSYISSSFSIDVFFLQNVSHHPALYPLFYYSLPETILQFHCKKLFLCRSSIISCNQSILWWHRIHACCISSVWRSVSPQVEYPPRCSEQSLPGLASLRVQLVYSDIPVSGRVTPQSYGGANYYVTPVPGSWFGFCLGQPSLPSLRVSRLVPDSSVRNKTLIVNRLPTATHCIAQLRT